MILPKGKLIWTAMRTSFVDVDELMIFLKRDEFTGYVKFEFKDLNGVVFFQEGDVVNGVTEIGNERMSGQSAMKDILEQATNDKKGRLSVSELPVETVAIFSDVFRFSVKLLYKELSSEFSNLGQFIGKLKTEGFTGYLEINFPIDKKQGIIYLEGGEIKAIFTEKLQFRLKEQTQTDSKFIKSFVEGAQRMGVLFDAYVQY
ncbi:MAG: hypothetical protein QNI92_02185 [Desulfobacterales bacterium]|nr:hypothetical protein [Desulfobacterales bacterium]MDJ0914613.1 hypothetical protein [Desulfobacterales bacterium]